MVIFNLGLLLSGMGLSPSGLPPTGFVLPPKEQHLEQDSQASVRTGFSPRQAALATVHLVCSVRAGGSLGGSSVAKPWGLLRPRSPEGCVGQHTASSSIIVIPLVFQPKPLHQPWGPWPMEKGCGASPARSQNL